MTHPLAPNMRGTCPPTCTTPHSPHNLSTRSKHELDVSSPTHGPHNPSARTKHESDMSSHTHNHPWPPRPVCSHKNTNWTRHHPPTALMIHPLPTKTSRMCHLPHGRHDPSACNTCESDETSPTHDTQTF